MKDEEMAEQFADNISGLELTCSMLAAKDKNHAYRLGRYEGFLAGLKAGRPQWHKIFEGDPYNYEYWDLPQDRLPKIENFYFVKLKNGFIKICELKYDSWSRKKYFYDLHGGKQSDIAEWLDYPTCDEEKENER